MDDALAQDIGSQRRSMNTNVLILVVMDDALAQQYNEETGELSLVLILVVMDDALAPNFLAFKAAKDTS